jgi:hypothetical protein
VLEGQSVRSVRFRFCTLHCIYRRRMRTYQHTAFAVHDSDDILYDGHKCDAGVGSMRWRRFLD